MHKELKHIFFDLDHTLWDFETNSKQTLEEMFSLFQLDSKGFTSFEAFHKIYKYINHKYWTWYRNGKVTKDQLRVGRFRDTLFEVNNTNEDLAGQLQAYYIYHSPKKKALMPGALEVLDHLRSTYEMHIITNGFAEVQLEKLKNCKIESYFNQLIISERVGFQKPDIRIFKHAEKEANTEALHCLMIGDSFEADILGATRAGWEAVHLLDAQENTSKMHGVSYIRNLLELKAKL